MTKMSQRSFEDKQKSLWSILDKFIKTTIKMAKNWTNSKFWTHIVLKAYKIAKELTNVNITQF